MTDSISRRGRDRDRNPLRDYRREQRRALRAQAMARLSAYLDAVTDALAEHGWQVARCALSSDRDLEAELDLRPVEPTNLEPGLAQPIQVRWEEDTGWCVSHHLLGPRTPALRHYMHTQLAPPPEQAAEFITAVLTPRQDPYDPDFAWPGMPYPAQFRFRSQPLAPVVDALERAITSPDVPTNPDPIDKRPRLGEGGS